MRNIKIEFSTDTDAFYECEDLEITHILLQANTKIMMDSSAGTKKLMDSNGNSIGTITIEERE